MSDLDTTIVRRFRIEGLHGYKTVEIRFEGPVKIVIAENGAGKTTILAALNAFLLGDFQRLKRIEFDRIECELDGLNKPISLLKSELQVSVDDDVALQLKRLSAQVDISDFELMRLASEISENMSEEQIKRHPVAHRIYVESPWGWSEVVQNVKFLSQEFDKGLSENIKVARNTVLERMADIDVLYFPTYRRIEEPQVKGRSKESSRYKYYRHRRDALQTGVFSRVNYGLEDVQVRLKELSEEIQRRTNFGYRRISEQIIDDLLLDKFHRESTSSQSLPEYKTLARFFSRIHGESPKGARTFERIQAIYNEETPSESTGPLKYFISQLSKVVDQTSKLETAIEAFVERVNAYLSSSSDPKEMRYDSTSMKVFVNSKWTDSRIDLNVLSSGEKQVVSLLAYIYLYDRQKIVLIDEPELSLSIKWQQRILPDVVSAGTCSQLLAITHSPFIFDNELDGYSEPLDIRRQGAQ